MPQLLQHPSFGSRDLPLSEDLTLAVQHAVPTGLVSQIHPDRDAFLYAFGLHRWLLTSLRTATLLHGRSPLHFECVCGSLSHPVDAGLLIPSRRKVHLGYFREVKENAVCRRSQGTP